MATGLKSRVLYKVHEGDTNVAPTSWAGQYRLMLRAKSIPSPVGERNMVDVSTLEDDMEVQEPGRRASASVALQGAFEKTYLDQQVALAGQKLDVIHLYGTDGLGSIGKLGYVGVPDVKPDDAEGDNHLTMTVNMAVSCVPEWISDGYDVTVTGEGDNMLFTVAVHTPPTP